MLSIGEGYGLSLYLEPPSGAERILYEVWNMALTSQSPFE